MTKGAKIKAADVQRTHQRQAHKRLLEKAFCGTVIITGFCPSEKKWRTQK